MAAEPLALESTSQHASFLLAPGFLSRARLLEPTFLAFVAIPDGLLGPPSHWRLVFAVL